MNHQEKEDNYIQVILQKQVDGILLVPAGSNTKSIQIIRDQGTPLVILDRRLESKMLILSEVIPLEVPNCSHNTLLIWAITILPLINGPHNVSTAEDR